jgi:dTDP-4-amino-4,6-dideoxygalactose transaminase
MTQPLTRPRPDFLPFALPDVDQREIDAVSQVVASGWLTTGPKVRGTSLAHHLMAYWIL